MFPKLNRRLLLQGAAALAGVTEWERGAPGTVQTAAARIRIIAAKAAQAAPRGQ